MTRIRAIIILVLFFMAITMTASVTTSFEANGLLTAGDLQASTYSAEQNIDSASRTSFTKIRDLFL